MNETLTAPHLLRPLWLLGLLLAPLVWRWLRHPPQALARWREAVDPHLLPHLLQGEPPRSGRLRASLGVTALVLAVVALAGPSWREQSQPLWRNRSPLVIAIDLSGAMLQQDVPPSRLVRARAKIADILRERGGGQIGLIAFADDAYTVAPLTDDVANIRLYLDALSPQVMPADGHRPGRAIEEAVDLLRGAGFEVGDILLITDAVDTDAIAAAATARADGYRVSALGVGGTTDLATLRPLALAGGGQATGLTLDDTDLRALGALVAERIDAGTQQGRRGLAAFDEGYWLLPPLLLLMVFAFRRGVLFALLLCVCLPTGEGRAQTPSSASTPARSSAQASAPMDEDGTLWRRADQVRHARMRAGVEAYRDGRYREAEQAWRGLPGADAAYNRGNALARQGRYEEAIAAYDQALREAPTMRDAAENRRAVEQAIRRASPPRNAANAQSQPQRKSGGDTAQASSGGEQDKATGASSGKPSGAAGKPQQPTPSGSAQGMTPTDANSMPAKPGEADSGDARSSEARSAQAKPANAGRIDPAHTSGKPDALALAGMSAEARAAREAAQRAADAAQRARMDRALAKAKQGNAHQDKTDGAASTSRDAAAARAAAQAARRRDLQLDAELRRVADDPGGLLRAKFLLEDRRRGRDR